MTKKFKELKQSTSVDEISLKSLSNTIAKSNGLKNTQKAMKKTKDDTKNDLAALRKRLDALKAGYAAESVELDENKSLIKDYEKYMSQGNKKDHNAIDYLMSMPKYKRMSKDQMAKMIGDHKRKGIFKEEVEVEESLSAAIKKKMDKDAKKQADAMAKVKAKGGVIGRTGSGVKMKEEVEQLEELTAAEKKLIDQMYDKKGNLTPLGKKVFAAGQKNEETELDEAPRRKGAPKMTGDSIAIQRAKDAEHAKAMGRSVKTGRKLPKKTMTSTQMSLASLRREEVELDEAKGMNMNLKLINKIKKSGVVKTGSMSKDGSKKEETNEVLDTPKALKTFNALRKKEDVSEAKKGGYDIYHKDFSGAMQHAYAAAKKNYGITIKPSEIDNKVASGPRKPSNGKTNTYRLEGDKGAIQVQVYNTGSKYELNMYKE